MEAGKGSRLAVYKRGEKKLRQRGKEEGEEETDYEGKRRKEALLKEMTPSWFTERLHWAAVPLCLMLSGCQRHSQQHCLAAPRGKLCWSMLSINSAAY